MRKALGIRHIALRVKKFKECLNFYTNILGMEIDWQPDEKNVYLTNGSDNLALHYCDEIHENKKGKLDHFGIMLEKKADVDYWFEHVKSSTTCFKKSRNLRQPIEMRVRVCVRGGGRGGIEGREGGGARREGGGRGG